MSYYAGADNFGVGNRAGDSQHDAVFNLRETPEAAAVFLNDPGGFLYIIVGFYYSRRQLYDGFYLSKLPNVPPVTPRVPC